MKFQMHVTKLHLLLMQASQQMSAVLQQRLQNKIDKVSKQQAACAAKTLTCCLILSVPEQPP